MRTLPPKLLVVALSLLAMVSCSSVSLDEPAPISGGTESGQPTGSRAPTQQPIAPRLCPVPSLVNKESIRAVRPAYNREPFLVNR
jgi:hypothetical protein